MFYDFHRLNVFTDMPHRVQKCTHRPVPHCRVERSHIIRFSDRQWDKEFVGSDSIK